MNYQMAFMTRYMTDKYENGLVISDTERGELSLTEAITYGARNWDKGTDFFRFSKSGNR